MKNLIQLGINIDHIATIRQLRGTKYPSVIEAALRAESAGADLITLHLREDRRHIQDKDVQQLRQLIKTRMNFEMAITDEMIEIASQIKPDEVCFVPERREELTTENGLDLIKWQDKAHKASQTLQALGVEVSVFITHDLKQIEAAKQINANAIEIHTGHFADLHGKSQLMELTKIKESACFAKSLGLIVNAGHGLNIHNVQAIASIPEIATLNIGHAIVAQAVFLGWENAIREMKTLMNDARL